MVNKSPEADPNLGPQDDQHNACEEDPAASEAADDYREIIELFESEE